MRFEVHPINPQARIVKLAAAALEDDGLVLYPTESGYAIGFSSTSDDGKWVIKAHASGNSQGHYGAAVGAGYMW